uniref:C2H2-type domain-containing protein n=1 Tax=Trichogramma kaykai TaxID=54128 RepID=A0ABD2X9G7_9HYME
MENFQSSRFEKENSIRRLQERDQNRKIHLDDVEIEFECRDQKPVLNSLLKMEDDSQNCSQDVKYGNDWATTNGIKREIVDERHLKTHIDTTHNGVEYRCDLCQKKFPRKYSLKRHIDAAHNALKITKIFIWKIKFPNHVKAEPNNFE